MGKFFVRTDQIDKNKIIIKNDDVNHIKNVLRLKTGDKINICNSDDSSNYICEIENIEKQSIECKIIEETGKLVEGNVELHIFQGLPKSDKMELVIQKRNRIRSVRIYTCKF